MHLVLQQEWINGKSYLVENSELNTLLDILNLSSDVLEREEEADTLSVIKEPEEVLAWDEEASPVDVDGQESLEQDILAVKQDEVEGEQLGEAAGANEMTAEIPLGVEELSCNGEEGELQQEDEQVLASEPEPEQDVVVAWYYWPNGTLLKG